MMRNEITIRRTAMTQPDRGRACAGVEIYRPPTGSNFPWLVAVFAEAGGFEAFTYWTEEDALLASHEKSAEYAAARRARRAG